MKKILISSFILVLIISIFNVAKASSASLDIIYSSSKVKVGNTFTVTLVGKAENDISALQANISYDKDYLSIESTSVKVGFVDFSENNEISIVSTESAALSKEITLYTITFKVLDTAKSGKTTIKFKDIALATKKSDNTQEAISIEDENLTITIEATDSTTINKEDLNNDKLPQTGIRDFSFVSVVVLVIISLIFYCKYRKV